MIGSGGPPVSEIDASRKKRLERAELLDDLQRRMVRQHDAAGANPDRRRPSADVTDQHCGRRAGDTRHVVMLGNPEALVAPTLGVLGEIERVAERLRSGATLDDRGEVEDGQRHHVLLHITHE